MGKMQGSVRWILLSLLLAMALAGCGRPTAVPTPTGLLTATRAVQPTATPTAVDPAQVEVLTWQREGGIAGFCDGVTVFEDGGIRVTSCREQVVNIGRLSGVETDRVRTWVNTLAPFEHVQTDDAVADGMTVRLTFAGQGAQPATEADLQAMLDFAAALARPMGPSGSAGSAAG